MIIRIYKWLDIDTNGSRAGHHTKYKAVMMKAHEGLFYYTSSFWRGKDNRVFRRLISFSTGEAKV